MKKIISIFLWFSLLFLQGAGLASGFSDVPADHKYAPDIQYLEERGVIQEDPFKPDDLLTREVFAKWLLKNSGFNGENYKPKGKKRFIDVKYKGNTYAPYIYRLAELGAVEFGTEKIAYFKPKNPVTKIEALSWLFNIEGIPVPKIFDEAAFGAADVKSDSKIAPVVNKALKLGLLNPGKVHPHMKVKRGEAARYLKLAKNSQNMLTVTIVPSVESDIIKNPKFDIMAGAWNKIFQDYLKHKDLKRDDLVYGAIEGMVKELGDKHSNFERPGDNALLESLSGEVEGIGAVIQMKDDEVVVVSPISDSPAEKAGLLPNDVITKVDGVSVKGMTLNQVVAKIRGPQGTQVALTIRRDSKTLEFTITRNVVKVVSAGLERTADNVAVIKLTNFGEKTDKEFTAVINDIKKNGAAGIVIDMRNNPGGFLTSAIEIAGHFIERGKTITTVRYPDREDAQTSQGNAELSGYKIAVLTNAGSASASEILAGALQDYGLAKIIGEKTYGKGTVQELADFSDGSTLKLTVAEWLTPNGHSIEKNGVTPDIEVKLTDEDRKAKRDPQMDRALEEVRK